ncbi:MAG: TMEM165/GDT1 family protein [Chloroflexi bacterium]|nr:TMEM165/GDT1 family protein [Chloroflexota bacterium]
MDWKLLVTTFGLLFLAELGDKTQLSVISMSAKSGKPWPVFVGAVGALAVVTLVGVMLGGVITRTVPSHYIRYAAGGSFLLLGGLMLSGKL